MRSKVLIAGLFLLSVTHLFGQYSLSGTKGLINVPEAAVLDVGTFQFGMHTNAEEYLLIDYGDNRSSGDEYISSVTIGFLDRISISVMLSRIFGDPKQTSGTVSSIGDRSVQVTGLVLKEGRYIPSVVVNLTDPFFSSNQFLSGNHVVATKHVMDMEDHKLKMTVGYGFPYVFIFAGQQQRTLKDKESEYLTGFFGGLQYRHVPTSLVGSIEYDGRSVNAGVGITLWERLTAQLYLQNFRYPGIGINYQGIIK